MNLSLNRPLKERRGASDDLMTVQLVPLGEETLTGKFCFLTNDVVGWTFLTWKESWDEWISRGEKKTSLKDLDHQKVRISKLDNDDEDSDSDESPSKGEDKLPDQICFCVELRIVGTMMPTNSNMEQIMKAETLESTTKCDEKYATLRWSLDNWKACYGWDAKIKSKVFEIETYQGIQK